MSVEQKNSRETIAELSSKQTKLMETQIEEMLSQLWEDTDLEKCYLKNYWEKYTWDIDQVKQLFSLAFIKLRDSKEIKSDNLLEVKVRNWGNLSVRDESGTRFTIVSDGKIVKSLWEEKHMRWLTYTKIEYTNPSWKTVIWYVSKSYTKKVNDSLNQLNWYLLSLGIQSSRYIKGNIYKSIDNIGTYKWTRSQNEDIYHYLVQNNEFDKSLAQLVSKEERGRVKEEAAKTAPKAISSEWPKLRAEASGQTLDTNDMLEGETRRVYEEIFADTKIVEYLNTNFKGNFNNFLKLTFGVNWWLNNIDVTWMARAYAYLFINAHKIDLYSYMKKHWHQYNRKNRDALYNHYNSSLNFSTDFKNLKTLYGLVIDKELWETLNIIKKNNETELQYVHGLPLNKIVSVWKDKEWSKSLWRYVTYCSRSAKHDLINLWVSNPAVWNASDIVNKVTWKDKIKEWVTLPKKIIWIETSIKDLEKELRQRAKASNVFDVYPETNGVHRVSISLGRDGQFYVLDPYYGTESIHGQLLENRVASMKEKSPQVLILSEHRV